MMRVRRPTYGIGFCVYVTIAKEKTRASLISDLIPDLDSTPSHWHNVIGKSSLSVGHFISEEGSDKDSEKDKFFKRVKGK